MLFSAADRAQYIAKRRRQTTTEISDEFDHVVRQMRPSG
jgi:hypothetical protein